MGGTSHVGEMIYYTSIELETPDGRKQEKVVGLASMYEAPHAGLLSASYGTYWTCQQKHDKLEFVDVANIKEVVMMAPDPRYPTFCTDDTRKDRFYMMRKPAAAFARFLSERSEFVPEEGGPEEG